MKSFLFLLFVCLAGHSARLVAQENPKTGRRATLDALANQLAAATSDDTLAGHVYNRVLASQNASIEREIILRQKLQYADDQTLALYKTKDSLLLAVGRAYELPAAERPDVAEATNHARALEETILKRLLRGRAYYMALSVAFMRELQREYPSGKCLRCYYKLRKKGGDQRLADQLYTYSAKKERGAPQWRQVRRELTSKEAAVEFLWYRDQTTGAMRYGALVLRRDYKAPRYVPLCDGQALADLLQYEARDETYALERLYQPPADEEVSTLYALIWAPLEPLLAGVNRVYYAPAGDLYRLNIAAAAPSEAKAPLQDRFELVPVNSTRGLVNTSAMVGDETAALPPIQLPCHLRIPVTREFIARFLGGVAVDYYNPTLLDATKTAVIFGNIYYDMDSAAIRRPQERTVVQPPKTSPPGPRKRQAAKGADWDFLEGTRLELQEVAALFKKADYKTFRFEGYGASEETFKTLGKEGPSPRVIHVATHGFFFADTSRRAEEDPLHRSGLILAGANYAWRKGRPLTGMEDGILTAYEIGLANLQNTELVVLSACETGLGYIVGNEGVFGLQRAFKKAGAKNLLVSLWSVPDKATQALMTQFYTNCLVKDLSIRDGLRAAQQWMRSQPAYKSPYYWAGFILLE